MKKIVLGVALMAGFAFASQAQKGSVLLYGDLSFSSEKDEAENKYTNFNVFPGIGYQFSNNWTAGITGGYGQSKYEPVVGAESKSSEYAIGVFGRFTQPLSTIFNVYGQADILYTGRENSSSTKFNGFSVNVTPAIQINVRNGFALNLGFGGISFESEKEENASEGGNRFGFSFGDQFNIGISKNFGKK
jgi:hypothetical protein